MVVVANTRDGQRLAELLGASAVSYSGERFPDGESAWQVSGALEDEVLVYFQFAAGEGIDAQLPALILLLHSLGASRSVHVLLPYFPYARALPLKEDVVSPAQLLLGTLARHVSSLMVIEPHCRVQVLQAALPDVRVSAITLTDVAEEHVRQYESAVLVSPDRGSAQQVKQLAERLRLHYVLLDKERLSATEVAIDSAFELVERHQSAPFIICDDIVSTGGTLRAAAARLRERGIEKIVCCVAHNVATERQLAALEKEGLAVSTSNTLQRERPAAIDVVPRVAQQVRKTLRLAAKQA